MASLPQVTVPGLLRHGVREPVRVVHEVVRVVHEVVLVVRQLVRVDPDSVGLVVDHVHELRARATGSIDLVRVDPDLVGLVVDHVHELQARSTGSTDHVHVIDPSRARGRSITWM